MQRLVQWLYKGKIHKALVIFLSVLGLDVLSCVEVRADDLSLSRAMAFHSDISGAFPAQTLEPSLQPVRAAEVMGGNTKAILDLVPNQEISVFTHHEAEIFRLLQQSGWVSPGPLAHGFIYMVSFRSCPDCLRFEMEEFPKLLAAGIEPRVIVIARRNRSTAEERTTVAELWANRNWNTYWQWTHTPIEAWETNAFPSGDNDKNRASLVEAGRKLIDALVPLLAENGVNFAYPTLIWVGRNGHLHGCACETRETYPYVRMDLGLPQR